MVLLAALAAVGLGGGFLYLQFVDKRSTLSRMVRRWNGEGYPQQRMNDLTEDLRKVPLAAQLQPWALDTMARFRARRVQGDRGAYLWWATNDFRLAPQEMPTFIRKQWAETNNGDVLPKIDLVLAGDQPDYCVIHWYELGIAVGPPKHQLSFNPEGTNAVAPGVYTYCFEK